VEEVGFVVKSLFDELSPLPRRLHQSMGRGFPRAKTGSVRRPKRRALVFSFLQFRTIEVTALEKRQRDFENPSLAGFEFKLLATLRCGTTHQAVFSTACELILRSQNNPNSALRTSDA
jgi:hypothetical protein